MIRDGRIDHALVVCGLLWWLQSRFPGRLVRPGPPMRWKLATVMKAVAALALILGLLVNVHPDRPGLVSLEAAFLFAVLLRISWLGSRKSLSNP